LTTLKLRIKVIDGQVSNYFLYCHYFSLLIMKIDNTLHFLNIKPSIYVNNVTLV